MPQSTLAGGTRRRVTRAARRACAALAVGGVAVAGCLFPSLDRFEGRGVDASVPAVDGALDSPADSPGEAASGFCGARPDASMCLEFSEPNALGAPVWSYTTDLSSDAGTIRLVFDGSSPTPPEARFALDWVRDGSACNYMRLTRRFPTAPRRFRAEMKVRPENEGTVFRLAMEDAPADAAVDSCVFTVRAATNQGTTQIQIAWDENGGSGRQQAQRKPTAPPFGRWQPVTVEVDLGAGTMTVDWDGMVQTVGSIPSSCKLTTMTPQIGVHCSSSPQAVSYDDVAFYVSP